MTDKNLLFRRTVAAIVSFVLCVSLAAMTVCAVIGTVCTEKYIKYVLKDSDYSDIAYSLLMNDLKDITIPSGLPADFFVERISKEVFNERTENAFSSNLSHQSPEFSVEGIKREFYDMLYEYALTQNRVVSDESEEALLGFAEECSTRYICYINPSSVKLVLTYIPLAKKLIGYGTIVSALLVATAVAVLYFLCRKKDFIKHLYFTFSGSALLLGVIPAVILISDEVRKIAITSQALYSLIVNFFEGALLLAIIFAAVYLLFAIIPIMVKSIIKNKK